MSYLDQTRRKNPVSVAAVVGVHLAVGYALLSGFAITVIKDIPGITQVVPISEPPPPPPHAIPTQRTKLPPNINLIPKPEDTFKIERPILPPPTLDGGPTGTINGGGSGPVEIAPPPPRPSMATDAAPARNWRNWITTDDYPTAALRGEVQGLVVISVTIGTDGRVRSCLVTQSSGSRLLDDTTCRLYTQRARFTPARDADGNPTVAQRTDRYRWQIPSE